MNETGIVERHDHRGHFTSAGLGINNATNNWADSADITAASTDLTAALTTLRSQAQAFGSSLSTVQIRQDFTKAMINTLQTGADALTLADSNEEGANLLALQTRQQLSTTALSLASQASQAVLRLFRLIRNQTVDNETAARKCRRFSLRARGCCDLSANSFNQSERLF